MTRTRTNDLITDDQTLVGAIRGNYPIAVYDDGFGPLWIHRDSVSISGIVRAQTWEDAYEICEDEFFPEANETIEEIVKEYGFKREHVKMIADNGNVRPAVYPDDYPDGTLSPTLTFVRWETIETPDPEAWPENELFCEQYGFRPNGPRSNGDDGKPRDVIGHGIYVKDLSGDRLERLTPRLIEELEIALTIEGEEEGDHAPA